MQKIRLTLSYIWIFLYTDITKNNNMFVESKLIWPFCIIIIIITLTCYFKIVNQLF